MESANSSSVGLNLSITIPATSKRNKSGGAVPVCETVPQGECSPHTERVLEYGSQITEKCPWSLQFPFWDVELLSIGPPSTPQ